MTTVDGRVLRDHARAVTALARELEVVEPALRTLPKLVARRPILTRIDLSRRIIGRFVHEAWRDERWSGIRKIFGGVLGLGRDSATAQRYARLANFPRGSVGYELHRYCEVNKFSLPGNQGAIPERVLFHDVGRLLSGYGNEPSGEMKQAAFQAGFIRKDGFAFLFVGVIQFHLGIQCTPVAKPEVGLFDTICD